MRISPDNNDVIVWLLNETSGNLLNSSTSPDSVGTDANLLTANQTGTLIRNSVGLFLPPNDNTLAIPGASVYPSGASATQNRIRTNGGLASLNIPLPMSVSGWVKLRHPFGATQALVQKTYLNNMASWASPFSTWGIFFGYNNGASSTDGSWEVDVTTGGVLKRLTMPGTSTVQTRVPPRGVWSHVGMTYDGSFLRAYLNGELAGSLAVTGAIDHGTSGPIVFGCVPTLKQEACAVVQDWRVANVARSLSYFQNIYSAGTLVL